MRGANLLHQTFGKLTVVSGPIPIRTSDGRMCRYWNCVCECGKTKQVASGNLVNGAVLSCGCLRDRLLSLMSMSHGLSGTPEHGVWVRMHRRCYDPKSKDFANYGGRGITVCEQWRDFTVFLCDLGSRPSPDHSIERIDNSIGYQPGNVKWATRHEQQRNKRTNVRLEFKGQSLVVADWAVKTGLPPTAIYKRIYRGWPVEKVLTEPLRRSA